MRSFLTFALVFVLASVVNALTNDWEIVGNPGFSAASALCCQIGFDNGNVLYVSYQDASVGGGRASVQRLVGGAWQYVGAPGSASAQQAWYNQLAFAPDNTPYITHRDYGASGRISIRRFDASAQAWLTVGPTGSSPDEAHYTTIALSHSGIPYVAYSDRSTSPIDRATAMRFVNGSWSVLGGFGLSPAIAGYPSLALDANDVPYVAFSDGGCPDQFNDGKATVMRYDQSSNSWSVVGAPGFTARGAFNAWLSFDRHNVPYVASQQYHQAIVVWKFDGTSWVKVGDSASGADRPVLETEGWRQWLSLEFDSQNTPYVAYEMLDNGFKAAVRKFDGTSWVPVGSLGFSAGAAYYPALAIDRDDVPYLVFRDPANGLRLTAMRYAPSPYTYCTGVLSSAGCTPQIAASGMASATLEAPFTITASQVINQRTGILLYALHPAQLPFQGGILCLQPPLTRAGVQNSGGTEFGIDCSGAFTLDFNTVIQGGTNPLLVPGQMVEGQWWYRDQQNPLGPGLSNAVRFTIGL